MFGPFIYTCDRSIEVYEQSKKFVEQSGHAEKIGLLAWVYHSVGDLVPHTLESFGSGHFFPWAESWNEVQISLNLCLFGLYKQAMMSLRSGLELGLLSVYWNLHDDGHIVIREWLRSKEDTPRLDKIWKRLEKHKNFQLFQQKHDIKTRLLGLGYLHYYVHSKGHKYSNSIGLLKSNFQTFEFQGFKIWFDAFSEVIRVLTILHLVKYPLGVIKYDYERKFGIDKPMLGGLEPFEIDQVEEVIGKEEFEAIEAIAQDDETVQGLLGWISNLPDMTEDDLRNQTIEFDKYMIESQGLEKWLEQERAIQSDRLQIDETYKRRVEYLIQWAKDNSFEKPAWER